MKLTDVLSFNPTTRLPRGAELPFIDMAALPTADRAIPSYTFREANGSGSKFQNGDTLLARITPCLENGKGGLVRGLPGDGVGHGSTEFIVLRPLRKAEEDFVYYVSRLPAFREFAIQQMTGTSGRQRVAWQSLRDFEIVELSPSTREGIGDILGALDDKIELNRNTNQTLEEIAQALFKDWFVFFGPTRAKMEGREPYLEPDLWGLFPDRVDHASGLPEDWGCEAVYDQAEWINGAAYKNMDFSDASDALPVVKIAELKAGITGNTKFTNTQLGDKYLIDSGELLFSWSGNPDTSIDAFIWQHGPAWLNQHIFAVRENGKLRKSFLYTLLRSYMSEFAEIARNKQTTGLGHVTKADMQRMMVCLGSSAVRKRFNELIEPTFGKLVANLFENRELARARNLLLPKLMSGEIRLREAEKIVGENL